MVGCLRTRVRKHPIIALYFELETVLKFYDIGAWLLYFNCILAFVCVPLLNFVLISLQYRAMSVTVNAIYVFPFLRKQYKLRMLVIAQRRTLYKEFPDRKSDNL